MTGKNLFGALVVAALLVFALAWAPGAARAGGRDRAISACLSWCQQQYPGKAAGCCSGGCGAASEIWGFRVGDSGWKSSCYKKRDDDKACGKSDRMESPWDAGCRRLVFEIAR